MTIKFKRGDIVRSDGRYYLIVEVTPTQLGGRYRIEMMDLEFGHYIDWGYQKNVVETLPKKTIKKIKKLYGI